jgi:hypothetical protein
MLEKQRSTKVKQEQSQANGNVRQRMCRAAASRTFDGSFWRCSAVNVEPKCKTWIRVAEKPIVEQSGKGSSQGSPDATPEPCREAANDDYGLSIRQAFSKRDEK